MIRPLLFFFIVILFFSCYTKNKYDPDKVIDTDTLSNFKKVTVLQNSKVSSCDYTFFADSVLHGYKNVLQHYFKKYDSDSCNHIELTKSEVIKEFQGFIYIGNINHNHIKDSVFVLGPINYCMTEGEEVLGGQSYYFTDTLLPRLQTDSYCCHPSDLFLVGDIDEDGISEIGQYYSSCASHYKSLHIYSLKNGKWKEVGKSTFDLYYMDINKPFSTWIRKVSKNKFEMLEITDLSEKTKIVEKVWLKFTIK